jgi:ubiquinone/menaquinone biosynthesis C-methylase UbiE
VLTGLLHRLASHPWVYDRIQTIVGHNQVLERLSKEIAPIRPNVVVDMGGGTGNVCSLLPADCRYICLDLEMAKLAGFRIKVSGGLAVMGDATAMPITDGCVDMVICKSVSHHLTDSALEQALDESRRVLRSGGHLVLFDAIFNPRRTPGRILWRLDRGSHPRTEDELRCNLSDRFKIIHWEKFAIYHEYVFGIGVRP